ncbi:MAG TPA: Fe-S cluster assembly scaffold protein NifU [Nanoarchaeota archaeon]|nr:Fe-S cluster assembly scaffold protein NifU [Nanoarchaeota archaeon]HIH63024.1 Fe-S cluster assembly scaffold protein NifU [Nanoarchaeota archaeon]HIJ09549.1 Fe-S cluster assembly scaffold protein NifU [Nanoarchaeota archaeon]
MQYSKKVMEEFMNPKNIGELKNPDGVGKVGNPTCGDIMQVHIKVKDNKIEDIKFKTFGCAAAIATSSMVTQLAMGKTLEEADNITYENLAESLKGLPPIKMHCSSMATKALKKAIIDYKTKSGGKNNGK